MKHWLGLLFSGLMVSSAVAAELPLIDVHIHYSHDAWQDLPPKGAIAVLRKAGLKRAFVSSSSDDGTQKLYAEAPDLIVPALRPYRSRGETNSWVRDESVLAHLEERLKRYRYAAIGEFHVYGMDADLPVMRRVVQWAAEYNLFLHAHADAEAVERLFAQDPKIRILWAHAGFAPPEKVREMLRRYPNLWADLAFRSDHASGSKVRPEWRAAFEEFPERFMLGTDTYTPERWHYVGEHANSARAWLADLPRELAERIAYRNAEALLARGKLACAPQPGGTTVQSGAYVLNYRPQPEPFSVGRPFALDISVCTTDGTVPVDALRVDARMPAHQHGMNYRPTVTRIGAGRFRADGLLLHMPGHWELLFDLPDGASGVRLVSSLQLQ